MSDVQEKDQRDSVGTLQKHILIWSDTEQVYYTVSHPNEIRDDDWLKIISGELKLYEACLTEVTFD